MIKAIVFALDGVLVETETQTFRFYQNYLRKAYSFDLPDKAFEKKMGRTSKAFFEDVIVDHWREKIDVSKLIEKKRQEFIKHPKDFILPFPQAKELLEHLAKKGLKLGLASQNYKVLVDKILSWQGWKKYFDVVVTHSDIKERKPSPEIFLQVARRLNLRPEECLAVEDSKVGVMAAKAAGMQCVGVEYFYTPPQELANADIITGNLLEIPLLIEKMVVA